MAVPRFIERSAYHWRNRLREALPRTFFQDRLEAIIRDLSVAERSAVERRVRYYNRVESCASIGDDAVRLDCLPRRPLSYYYDLSEYTRYFRDDLRIALKYGDIIEVPPSPTIVKTRPIGSDNRNSILFNLDKLRHFHFPPDPVCFEQKKPKAVWRGAVTNNRKRARLLEDVALHPLCDIAHVSPSRRLSNRAGFLSRGAQMRFRYIISIEGFDVATNLKWIMSSNSLCLMPQPVYEGWFMEGTLEAGRHYARVRDDFADLDDTISYYEAHWDEARAIVAAANAHVRQFRDARHERLVSLLVLYRYFVASGQLAPEPHWADLVGLRHGGNVACLEANLRHCASG